MDKRSGFRALAWTPLVTALAWYLTTMGRLAWANGGLRWLTDVVVFGIGALTIGLFVSLVVTVSVVAPLWVFLRPEMRSRATVVFGVGVVVGAAVSGVFGWLEGDFSSLPLWQGILVGLLTAGFFRWQTVKGAADERTS